MNQTPTHPSNRRHTLSWVLLEFFGSMNLAITLLVLVAVASVIGTVLQQNQPYPDYVFKFGPFWFEVFRWLGLYDVYGASWFIGILAFLILSTSVCLYRQVPRMLRDMIRFRTNIQPHSLRGFHQHIEWQAVDHDLDATQGAVTEVLQKRGYRWRARTVGDHRVVAAMKGRYNRLGYLFTHAAVVLIGVGGLLDGNLWLKLKEWRGEVVLETHDLAVRDIPPASRLAPGALPAFRGNVMIPEGTAASFVFVRARNGFVLQELPFAIELKDFQVAYHDTGQPKSFLSQVLIHDREKLGDHPLEATIRVNHPFTYRGYSIYQSDFGDGGSVLDLRAWPLTVASLKPTEIEAKVGGSLKVARPGGTLILELSDFRLFNLLPESDVQPGERKFRNFGPSFGFKLRDEGGQAWEYFNYMAPVKLEDRWFFISGMRTQPSAPFTYLHIPADPNNSPERFLRFNARLHDADWLRTWMANFTPAANEDSNLRHDLERVRVSLVELFAQGGSAAVLERAKAVVPADRLQEASALYLNILRDTLAQVFIEVLREEGIDVAQGVGEREEAFFNDALSALSALPAYASPFYLQLASFRQVEASGLQVTRSDGVAVVYTGFAMLIMGVFIMFYTSHRRLWAWLAVEKGATRLLLAGTGNRHQTEFAHEFAILRAMLEQRLGTAEAERSTTTPSSAVPQAY